MKFSSFSAPWFLILTTSHVASDKIWPGCVFWPSAWWRMQYTHQYVNTLWPCDAVWRHRSGPTLAQIMVCCLTTPSHYLNQCRLLISKFLWHSPKSNTTLRISNLYQQPTDPCNNPLAHEIWNWSKIIWNCIQHCRSHFICTLYCRC